MAKRMKGVVAQFGTKGYGFITGEDGEKYFVHQKNIVNKSRLKVDTVVAFNAESSDKGLVATQVEAEGETSSPTMAASNSAESASLMTKVLFALLFLIQAVVIYKVFFTSVS